MVSSYVGENKEFERQFLVGRAGGRARSRRARWPSGSAPAAPASAASTPPPAWAPRWPRARRRASSTAASTSSRCRSAPTSPRPRLEGRPLGQPACSARPPGNFNPLMAHGGAGSPSSRREHIVRGRRARPRPDPHPRHLREAGACRAPDYEKWIEQRTVRPPAGEDLTMATHPRTDRPARRPRAARRLLRQPRHRHAHAGRQLHPAGDRGRAPVGERACSASGPYPLRGAGGPGPHQRRQGDRHRDPGRRRTSTRPSPSR